MSLRLQRSAHFTVLLSALFLIAFGATPSEADDPVWHNDYQTAIETARSQQAMLLIVFHDGDVSSIERALGDVSLEVDLQPYVLAHLSTSLTIEGESDRVIDTEMFRHMVGRPGLVILDFSDPEAPFYGEAVSQFPLDHSETLSDDQLRIILNLPCGSLTQRTMIYAVRTHDDKPESASGEVSPYLCSRSEEHSLYQAQLRRQGHHHWNRRFHEINDRLPDDLVAYEVCAESWPGEEIVPAAISCVSSWRQSPGHWRLVGAAHPQFSYDMKRGSDGVWYATGIFGASREAG